MSREMWSQLKKYENGDGINAETMNVPIGQLGDRTSYLYARLKELMSVGKMSSVILTGVELSSDKGKEPDVGNAVYLDSGKFSKAKATMSLYDDFKAADSAFTVGILISKDGYSGNVIVYGSMNLNPSGSPILESSMIESGERFRPGRYYLSANEAGKLTANPNGPLIYVCTIEGSVGLTGGFDGTAIVSPQFLDIGTSHIHRTAVLTARPAGTSSVEGYLPIDPAEFSPEDDGQSSSGEPEKGHIALRFGGTWTNDGKVDYDFFLGQTDAQWPNGVTLCWRENGGRTVYTRNVTAPDAEIEISNGLTARLSLPQSRGKTAYSGLTEDQIRWETLTFPDAGKGWLAHLPQALAKSDDAEGLCVALRGRVDSSPSDIDVIFPGQVDSYDLGSDDSVFSYEGQIYEFTDDKESYSGEGIPVPRGTCLADSALYLAEALSKGVSDSSSSSGARFAVFEYDEGAGAKLLVIDGSRLVIDAVQVSPDTVYGADFDVIPSSGDINAKAVVCDRSGRVLSADPVISIPFAYAWTGSGKISVMVYQDTLDSVTVQTGTCVSATMVDDEPDAVYDYVIGMDAQISNFWPPVPPKSAALIVNGVEMDNKALVPTSPTVSFGRDTIHWFEDDEGRRPWPDTLEGRDSQIDPAFDKTEIMHWVRGFQGATGPVTSLQVKPGSPLKVYGYGTFDEANTGDLEIAADLDFRIENGGAPGYHVPKRTRNGVMLAGPVVERIVGGPGVSVISKAGCPNGQGTVVVALDNGAFGGLFTDIALENAEQAKIGMFPYIRLKGYSGSSITHPSAFTATVRVPDSVPAGKYVMRVSASVFGEDGFRQETRVRNACVRFSYNILPDFRTSEGMEYRNLKTTLLKPDSERIRYIPFGHNGDEGIEYNGFDPIIVTTHGTGTVREADVAWDALGNDLPDPNDFSGQEGVLPEIRPGYLIGIRIARAVSQDATYVSYTGPLGFMNLSWSLLSAD